MAPARRVAVTVPGWPEVRSTIELIKWAESNGYTDAWFGDSGAPDSLTQAAAVAQHSTTIRIGIAATPVYTRSPSVIAASVNTIGQLLPGRFVMGIGSSSQTMMGRWNGIPLDKPLTRVRETAELVRSMLAGARTDFSGATLQSHGYRQPPLENPPPIYIAALRPKMIEMAAEVGDGVIFNLWPKSALPRMVEHVRLGAERGGKNPEEVEVVHRAMVLATDDKPAARNLFRAAFAPYYATPVYNRFLAWAGYPDVADTITEGWARKDRAMTTGALSDELIDEIAVIGTENEIHRRFQEHAEMGVHTHIVAPLGASQADMDRTFAAFTAKNFRFE